MATKNKDKDNAMELEPIINGNVEDEVKTTSETDLTTDKLSEEDKNMMDAVVEEMEATSNNGIVDYAGGAVESIPVQKSPEYKIMETELETANNGLEKLKKAEASLSRKSGPAARPGLFPSQQANSIHTINGGSTQTIDPDEIKRKQSEIELYQSLVSNKVLKGFCFGVEEKYDPSAPGEHVRVFATVKHGPHIIDIPSEEYTEVDMVALNKIQRERYGTDLTVAQTAKRYLQYRRDVPINYVITNIPKDEQNSTNLFVAGSRLKANRRNRIHYWFGRTNDGQDFMKIGDKSEALVVSSSRAGIRVEVFGVETYITARELTWSLVQDARDLFVVGDKVTVMITDIDRNIEKDYSVSFSASVKAALKDPREEGMSMFVPNGLYTGIINYIRLPDDTNPNIRPVVFIRLAEGVQCMCPVPNS